MIESDSTNRKNSRKLIVGLAAIGVVALVTASALINRDSAKHESSAPGSVYSGRNDSSDRHDLIDLEARALAAAERKNFRKQAEATLDAITRLEERIAQWNEKMASLLQSEEGKYIAANEDWVLTFQKGYNEERPVGEKHIAGMRSKVAGMLSTVVAASAEPDSLYVPSEEFFPNLASEHERVVEASKDWERATSGILSLVELGKKQDRKSSMTLQEAISKIESDHAAELARATADLVRKKMADHNAELLKLRSDAKDAELADAIEKERLEKMQEKQTRNEALAAMNKKRLLAEAQEPSRLKRFEPVLTKGMQVLPSNGSRAGYVNIRQGQPKHLSLTNLEKCGYLESAERFSLVITAAARWNFRPGVWSQPKTEADWARVSEALEEFKKYAESWVELGMLNQ